MYVKFLHKYQNMFNKIIEQLYEIQMKITNEQKE